MPPELQTSTAAAPLSASGQRHAACPINAAIAELGESGRTAAT